MGSNGQRLQILKADLQGFATECDVIGKEEKPVMMTKVLV